MEKEIKVFDSTSWELTFTLRDDTMNEVHITCYERPPFLHVQKVVKNRWSFIAVHQNLHVLHVLHVHTSYVKQGSALVGRRRAATTMTHC